jgi:hypothetical protein
MWLSILPYGYLFNYLVAWLCQLSSQRKCGTDLSVHTWTHTRTHTHTHTHRYEISGIPALIVINPDGTLVTKEGRNDVMQAGFKVMSRW